MRLDAATWLLAGLMVCSGCRAAKHGSAARASAPVRDPHTAGYVQARQLPDMENAPPGTDGNFILGPTHKPAAESTAIAPGLRGRIVEFHMDSRESHIFPGIARDGSTLGVPDPNDPTRMTGMTTHPAPYTRKVAVYIPRGYMPGSAVPFLVGADGPDPLLFTVLDALIAAGRLPPLVAISIANGGGDAQGSQRGLEYDTMSGRYAEFVESEVLPRVEREAGVTLTHDPEGRAAMGGSSGASCSLAMAWYHPEWYHRVLSYSGTFVNQQWPHNDATPHGAWEWPEHLVAETPRKPIRIWMEVGDRDFLNPNMMRDGMHDWVLANEKLAAALATKGYHYQFVFARNAGHVDRAVREQTLAEALEYLWYGYGLK